MFYVDAQHCSCVFDSASLDHWALLVKVMVTVGVLQYWLSVCFCWCMRSCSSTGFSLCPSWFPVACVLVGSVCIVAGSRGLAGVCCCSSTGFRLCPSWFPVACVLVGSVCIVAGSRGSAGVCCCSSTGFSLCLSWLPVACVSVGSLCILLLAV